MMKSINKRFYLLMWIVSALWPACRLSAQPPFYVNGRFLYDGCGERVILRGTNVMTAYRDYGGATTFPQLAQTGANCARIWWQAGDSYLSASHLDATMQNCINSGMIPMVGIWNATGDCSSELDCADLNGDLNVNLTDFALIGLNWK